MSRARRPEPTAVHKRPCTDAPAAPFPLTESGNGERLAHRWGHVLRFIRGIGWAAYDGKRWRSDAPELIARLAKETARSINLEAAAEEDDDRRKRLRFWAETSESLHHLDAMQKAAKNVEDMVEEADAFDVDPLLLNLDNGTLDLRTGTLRDHDPADRITGLVPIDHDPTAECPRWLAFLDHIFAKDRDLIAYVCRVVGYILTGLTREQVFFVLYGSGANGKSVFLRVLAALLGTYVAVTPTETFLATRGGGIPNDLAALVGKRFVSASEADEGRRLAEATVKALVGGDPITARFLHREFFTFTPRFKVAIATNHRPEVRGTDHGLWRRIRLIPFDVTIPEQDQDDGLGDALLTELPGVLNWAVQGCLDWQRGGLKTPETVKGATADYRKDMDVLGTFLAEACETGEGLKESAAALFAAHRDWARRTGEPELSQTALGRRLAERGFTRDKSGSVTWFGLRLKGGSGKEKREGLDGSEGSDPSAGFSPHEKDQAKNPQKPSRPSKPSTDETDREREVEVVWHGKVSA